MSIHSRLNELRILKPGWLDGKGSPLDPAGMDWLESALRDHGPTTMPAPHIFPSPDGQVLFEWSINSKSASLEIDLAKRMGYWHVLDLKTRKDSEEDLDLDSTDGWNKLAEHLASIRAEKLAAFREGDANDR